MRKVIQVTTYPFGLCGLKPRINPAADEDFGIRPKRLEGQYQPTLLDVAKAYEAIVEALPASRGGK